MLGCSHTYSYVSSLTAILFGSMSYFLFFPQLSQIFRSTSDTGVHIRSFHPHKLYFKDDLNAHSCDICRRRFRRGQGKFEGYTCRVCDFDVCLRCFKLRGLDRGEGLLRSDQVSFIFYVFMISCTSNFTHDWRQVVIAVVVNLPPYHSTVLIFSRVQNKS